MEPFQTKMNIWFPHMEYRTTYKFHNIPWPNHWIKNNKLSTATYQKPLKLYLYIPPLSAHPSSCLKGLLTGELNRYWFQNSEKEDFIDVTTKFILWLVQRGHQMQHLIPSLYTVAAYIDNINTRESHKNPNGDKTLYIHWRHHPFI